MDGKQQWCWVKNRSFVHHASCYSTNVQLKHLRKLVSWKHLKAKGNQRQILSHDREKRMLLLGQGDGEQGKYKIWTGQKWAGRSRISSYIWRWGEHEIDKGVQTVKSKSLPAKQCCNIGCRGEKHTKASVDCERGTRWVCWGGITHLPGTEERSNGQSKRAHSSRWYSSEGRRWRRQSKISEKGCERWKDNGMNLRAEPFHNGKRNRTTSQQGARVLHLLRRKKVANAVTGTVVTRQSKLNSFPLNLSWFTVLFLSSLYCVRATSFCSWHL